MSAATNTTARQGFLALELDGDGAHPAAWRAAAHAPAALLSGDRIRATVLAAESAGFHAATFADGPVDAQLSRPGVGAAGRLDAVQRAAFASPLTRSIVLVPQVDTVFTEPFHVATQLASLDYVSGGRAGWLVSASGTAAEGAAVGRTAVAGDGLAGEAAASIEVGRRLWDSWEDGAVVRDVASGRYLDVDQLHYADFDTEKFFPAEGFPGAGYSVKGPAIIPRPLQGQLPVLVPAELFAQLPDPSAADAVLVSAPSTELLATEVAELRGRLDGAGPAPAIIAELDVVLDARGQSAADRVAALDAHTPWHNPRARYVGSAEGLVELLAEVLAAADGVRLHPAVVDVDVEELSRLVLPALRRRGTLAPTLVDGTFRDLLGLGRPANRYTAEREEGERNE
ncbi:LLM class flavin-dependent oxidoreductase [Arthrobacter sp. 35W]|uniref:LLM class flavin-dependent oxidoreductase n=1 Tax=Arthrobacter sp. 35W TaxID=1132441 RepID=UPI00041959D1|nr:LLM class flavin-dependent oxidoreductase [Arthrobacter sp. 35W]